MRNIEPPSFIGIGASFAGWTEIKQLLTAHPGVVDTLPALRYFDTKRWREKDASWYVAGLPARTHQTTVTGEVSVSYLSHAPVPERIVKTFPDTKLVAAIRHPLERAIAEYQYYQRLPQAVKYESCSEFLQANHHVVERGMYGKLLQRYLAYYSPLELHIITYDDLREMPLAVVERLYRFLDIDPNFVPERLHPFVTPEERPLRPSLYQRLKWLIGDRYQAWHLARLPVWDPPRPVIRQYFTPAEEQYWIKQYWADAVLLSDIVAEDMTARWYGEEDDN